MKISQLTIRARNLLHEFDGKIEVELGKLLIQIDKSNGLGSFLIHNVPLTIGKGKKKLKINDLIVEAFFQASKLEASYVGTEHLLLAGLKIVQDKQYERAKNFLERVKVFPDYLSQQGKTDKTPYLSSFSTVLTKKTNLSKDKFPFERAELNSLISGLMLKTIQGVLLVGEPGVGKRDLIQKLASKMIRLEVPISLIGRDIFEFDIISFMTSLANRGGNFEFGISQLNDELRTLNKPVIYIKDFQSLFFSTSMGMTAPVFYNMFKSTIIDSGAYLLADLPMSLYEKILTENEHVLDDFFVVEITEPDDASNIIALKKAAEELSKAHGVKIPTNIIDYVYKKAKTLNVTLKFPQKGIDLLDHCCTRLILKSSRVAAKYKKTFDESIESNIELDNLLEKGSYEKALSAKKKLYTLGSKLLKIKEFSPGKYPILTIKAVDEALLTFKEDKSVTDESIDMTKFASLAKKVKERIVGQENAVDLVTKALIRSRLGLRSKKRPLGNFLFLGPTGVGKTELAKVLADEFFGEDSLIRLDMSDFGEKHTVARLVGAPPGYVGYGEGGELTTKISSKPDCVVLFDEIEKAHPDVLNILLQIMEEGELADAKGNTFDFSKSVVVLTSNAGTEILHNSEIGFEPKLSDSIQIEKSLLQNLKKLLKPELINRFDEIIVFNQLNTKTQKRVLDILIKEITDNLHAKNISLQVKKAAKEYLLEKGYSKEYGARSLRRVLERELLDRIAEYLLDNEKRPLFIEVEKSGKGLGVVPTDL
ncbi:hypothetical protein A3K34_00425 [candidate division WWE3 bacterium RIFOXYC1_FULL_40_10]|uniref:Clp R domain-containing protein n=1 Tax=candidate division WWE3 bacterium RIFOXYA2_FULL_46_9 TaxID=1802636 RepID=A0A1F4VYV9_UNCKA|nr:MAG: hypothetical protein A3K58_00425 [candidate division WWE3 bacterium RIFOXYB1_FULL_40_22]OGC61350.1 MAG: hypothetical protein A3K37_00425 [candidate division WWE3 bacterium RIFOXYA1_FULL_40_11]OGC62366.1 MAG: hypothetical protein A2264_05360 [candidate division WWE3 bacterium RIFOXYA2_FULL_46_9]OGC65340.1 MAG: hypothetical protein A2326_04710 [candidate division WWE3 bacterium RIFOXYB2_FULL_41_6]OGC65733.1 MAG: hypothetical protein A3K34_00425 [candidate division WWE3 bacterium RIFOXYC1_